MRVARSILDTQYAIHNTTTRGLPISGCLFVQAKRTMAIHAVLTRLPYPRLCITRSFLIWRRPNHHARPIWSSQVGPIPDAGPAGAGGRAEPLRVRQEQPADPHRLRRAASRNRGGRDRDRPEPLGPGESAFLEQSRNVAYGHWGSGGAGYSLTDLPPAQRRMGLEPVVLKQTQAHRRIPGRDLLSKGMGLTGQAVETVAQNAALAALHTHRRLARPPLPIPHGRSDPPCARLRAA